MNKTTSDIPFNLNSSVNKGGSNGSLTFTIPNPADASVATISGSTLTIVGAGTATINVSLAASADGIYSSATTSATLTVNKVVPSLSLSVDPDPLIKTTLDASFNIASLVNTDGSSGLLTFESSENNVAIISENRVVIVGAGTSTITVNIAASADGKYAQSPAADDSMLAGLRVAKERNMKAPVAKGVK